jgi:hypothetical protein
VRFLGANLFKGINLKNVKDKIHNGTGCVHSEGELKAYLYSFFNLGVMWCGWTTLHPYCFTFGKETCYPLCKRMVGPQGRSGRERKISPPPGFDPPDRPFRSVSLSWPTKKYYEMKNETKKDKQ